MTPLLPCQGNCYVWNLTGGIGDEVTQLIPKTKIPAHTRYALQCRFSPDSTCVQGGPGGSGQVWGAGWEGLLLTPHHVHTHSQAPCHLLRRPDMQDLEDIQLLPDDGVEHQEQQPRRVVPRLDVGVRLLGGLPVHRHR